MKKELSVEARREIADAYDGALRCALYLQLQGRVRRVVEAPYDLTPEDVAEDVGEFARAAAHLYQVIHGYCVWEDRD